MSDILLECVRKRPEGAKVQSTLMLKKLSRKYLDEVYADLITNKSIKGSTTKFLNKTELISYLLQETQNRGPHQRKIVKSNVTHIQGKFHLDGCDYFSFENKGKKSVFYFILSIKTDLVEDVLLVPEKYFEPGCPFENIEEISVTYFPMNLITATVYDNLKMTLTQLSPQNFDENFICKLNALNCLSQGMHLFMDNRCFEITALEIAAKVTDQKILFWVPNMLVDVKIIYPDKTVNTSTKHATESTGQNYMKILEKLHGTSKLPEPKKMDVEVHLAGMEDTLKKIFHRAFATRTLVPDVLKELHMRHEKGLLLYGPPGTGKTVLAIALAKMQTESFTVIKGPELKACLVGNTEKNIRDMFKPALDHPETLHVIIIDEIDAMLHKRNEKDGEHAGSAVNQFLAMLDGPEQIPNVFIIGTTNRKELIDPAAIRPGRIGLHLEIALPDEKLRMQILRYYFEPIINHGYTGSIDYPLLVRKTQGKSGADIAGYARATVMKFLEESTLVSMDDILDIVKDEIVVREELNYYL